MKKILALTLCVVMAAAAFTGCGNKSSNGEADGAPITVISREDGSGTRGAFTELMGVMVDDVDNKEYLTGLFNSMYDELPAPKPKKKK